MKLKPGDEVIIKKVIGKNIIVDRYKALDVNKKQYKTFYVGSIMADFIECCGDKSTKTIRQDCLKRIPANQKNHFKHLHIVRIERKYKWFYSILNKLAFWKKRK